MSDTQANAETAADSVPEPTTTEPAATPEPARAELEQPTTTSTPPTPQSNKSAPETTAAAAETPQPGAPEIIETAHEPVEVKLVRSVRIGRIIIAATALGAVIAALFALVLPVGESADYTLGQAVGLSLVIGGAVGMLLGSLFALVLNLTAKRKQGAAMAVRTDVR